MCITTLTNLILLHDSQNMYVAAHLKRNRADRGVQHFLTLFPLSPSCRWHLLTHSDHFLIFFPNFNIWKLRPTVHLNTTHSRCQQNVYILAQAIYIVIHVPCGTLLKHSHGLTQGLIIFSTFVSSLPTKHHYSIKKFKTKLYNPGSGVASGGQGGPGPPLR